MSHLDAYNRSRPTYIYVSAWYFVFTSATTIGYGDIYSYNQPEKIYALFLEAMSILIFSYITSSILSMTLPKSIRTIIKMKQKEVI